MLTHVAVQGLGGIKSTTHIQDTRCIAFEAPGLSPCDLLLVRNLDKRVDLREHGSVESLVKVW